MVRPRNLIASERYGHRAPPLERLLEAVHVDHSSAARLREEVADISRHGLDPIKTPVAKSDCGERGERERERERETAIVGRHELRPCNGHCRSPLYARRTGTSTLRPACEP